MKEKGLFHTILSRDPDGARQMAERLLAEKERRQEHHCEVILRPYFGSLDQIRTLRHAGRLLVKCIEEICAAALSNDPLLERLGLTIEERKLARIDHGNSGFSVFPQIETSLTRHGLHIVDIIADGLPDIANAFEMARLRSSNPTSREFTRHYQMKVPPFYELIHELFLSRYARWGGRSQTPTIALILDMSAGISIEASMIHGHLNSAGLTTLVCDPRDLLFHDSRLMAHGSAVDIAYRLAPLTESNMGDAASLIEAVQQNAVCLINPFKQKLSESKAIFDVLTHERYRELFTPRERLFIRKHIPWSRVMEEATTYYQGSKIDLPRFARHNRHLLCLTSMNGQEVFVGQQCDQAQWEAAIDRALGGKWLLQTRVLLPVEDFPVWRDEVQIDSFGYSLLIGIFDTRVAGGWARLSKSSFFNPLAEHTRLPIIETRKLRIARRRR